MVNSSPGLYWPFLVLALVVAASIPLGVRAAWLRTGADARSATRASLRVAALLAAWLGATGAAAAAGVLSFDTVPPTALAVVAGVFALSVGLGLSGVGKRIAAGLPLAALVGVQAFRLPLELLMHRAYVEGMMPVQMSYSGWNFDIVTGITAPVLAGLLLARRAPLWLVRVWNWMGTLLLVNVVAIALLSTPLPIRLFHDEPANVWITWFPYVWLPASYVVAAFLGHVVIFRRLAMERKSTDTTRVEPRREAVVKAGV